MGERYVRRPAPFQLVEVNLLTSDDQTLGAISQEMGLALSLEEMRQVQEHFRARGRNPTDVELQALGQAWSEHCCYKSSKAFLREYLGPCTSPDVLEKGDAGVVAFDDEYAYALRIESHNHPSAVEPYGGAATGIGGILRDVLAMGAQPVALVDPLHFGPLDYPYEKLPKGVKHPRYLFGGVVAGIRDYGNRVGIPTVSGLIAFDEGFVGNCLVNVGCVGFVRRDKFARNRVAAADDVFVLVGGKTGRDGIHGVTYASLDLTEEMTEAWSGGAVQLGDPILKEPLIHACLEAVDQGLLHGMKDLGGGGLSCVVGEMAYHGGFGAEVDLEKVSLKEEGLAPWEIWVSESQERMMLAVSPANVPLVLRLFDLYDVPATPIGRVIPEKVARVRYKGHVVMELDLKFYVDAVEYRRPAKEPPKTDRKETLPREPEDYAAVLRKLLASPNIASKEYVVRQYDHEVRAATVIKPIHGKVGKSGPGDAAVLKPREDSWKGLAIAVASTPRLTALHPFRGGASCVDEVVRNLASVGARPHSLSDCLNFGNPEKPDRLWAFAEATRGIGYVAQHLGLAIPSGNVSFYNEGARGPAPPTPVALGVGLVDDIRRCVTSDLKAVGNPLYVVGETTRELGGSEYFRLFGGASEAVPDVDVGALRANLDFLLGQMREGRIAAAHDVSQGGLAVAAAEMAIGGDAGVQIDLSDVDFARLDLLLFSESNSRWIVEVKKAEEERFLESAGAAVVQRIGEVGGADWSLVSGRRRVSLPVADLRTVWSSALPKLVSG